MNLEECRNKIDEIDKELLKLFTERMNIVKNVAEYKRDNNLPILNTNREQQVIDNKLKNSPDNIHEYVKSFFVNLMEISKCYQLNFINNKKDISFDCNDLIDNHNIKVICQGTKGAYQHTVSTLLFPNSNIGFCETYKDVFDSIANNNADFAVVPLENSTAGSVTDVYDLLSQNNLFINSMYKLKIEHCLAVKEDTNFENLTAIYSYIQALDQCSNFIKSTNNISINQFANTALAAEYVSKSNGHIGAICSKDCAKMYNLKILKDNIQNNSENYTKFIVVSKTLNCKDNFDEIAICVKTPNKSGELNKMLTKFSLYSIDMTKISSRPIGDKDFGVLFFINFKGNLNNKNTQELLQDLCYNYDFVKVLGSYQSV